MRYNWTKKFGFFSLNILVNASLMNEAVKANNNYQNATKSPWIHPYRWNIKRY